MKDAMSIDVKTQLCAIIGNPVTHSLSPAIHNAAFAAADLNYVYLAFQVEDVKSVLTGMRAMPGFRGLSVTIPHKIDAAKYVDEVAEVDRKIGSINTVINEQGKLFGLGTDGPGALKALRDAGVEIDGANILILGSGGAARAIAFTLAEKARPGMLTLLDVNETMLRQLTRDLQAGTNANILSELLNDYSLANVIKAAEIVIHCTPIGMHPHEDASLIPIDLFQPGQVVFDIVYTPLETKLVVEAKSRGCKIIPGVEMFINQAVLQFEQFTGVNAPVDVMRQVVMDHLKSNR